MTTEAGFHKAATEVELPTRAFLYTLDQVAFMLSMSLQSLRNGYIHFYGVTQGVRRKHFITARNISPPGVNAEWRVAETELVRWMKLKGFRFRVNGRIVD